MTRRSATRLVIVQVPGVLISSKNSWRKEDPQKQNRQAESSSHFESYSWSRAGRRNLEILLNLSLLQLPKMQQATRLFDCVRKQQKTKNFYCRIFVNENLVVSCWFSNFATLELGFHDLSQFSEHLFTISQMFLIEKYHDHTTKLARTEFLLLCLARCTCICLFMGGMWAGVRFRFDQVGGVARSL